jgi:hypothetical protein
VNGMGFMLKYDAECWYLDLKMVAEWQEHDILFALQSLCKVVVLCSIFSSSDCFRIACVLYVLIFMYY